MFDVLVVSSKMVVLHVVVNARGRDQKGNVVKTGGQDAEPSGCITRYGKCSTLPWHAVVERIIVVCADG